MSFLKNIFGTKEKSANGYAEFWNWFRQNERSFYNTVKNKGNVEKNFFAKLHPKLNELKDGFWYLVGMYDDDTAELVLTADGVIKNFVFVEELVQAAPQLDGWKFTALKPALEKNDVYIQMGDCNFSDENLWFYANELRDYPDEVDITVLYENFTEENKDTVTNGVYIFLDNYLGELDFAVCIDNLEVIGTSQAEKELIPIKKLKDYLKWRQAEFVEKYEDVRHNSEDDAYAVLEAQLQSGYPLIAAVNTDLLQWNSKVSHPWILSVEMPYDGNNNNGLPNEETQESLQLVEEAITAELKDVDGYLYMGRQSVKNSREIYFACKDFRKPSKVLYEVQKSFRSQLEVSYDIYKDKYWQSFDRFLSAE